MSKRTQQVLGIAIIVIVVLLGFTYWKYAKAPSVPNPDEVTTLPSGSNTSDAALEDDLGAIDIQLDAATEDNTQVSASIYEATQQ